MNDANVALVSQTQSTPIAEYRQGGRMSVGEVVSHVRLIQEVMQSVMKKDVHYGIIPGCDKPSLLKPGAEVLCVTFRVAPSFEVEDLSTDESARYRVRCIGTSQTTGAVIAEGMGECSSMEEKYKWRKATKKEFENTPENRRRIKYGYNRQQREEYEIKQVRTESADLANTILKMACKRAHVGMALNGTGASDMFAQDLEDLPEEYLDTQQEQKPVVSQPKAKSNTEQTVPPAARAQAPDTSGPLREGMVKVIKAKLIAAALTESDVFKKFGVPSWDAFTASQANAILDFIKNPG